MPRPDAVGEVRALTGLRGIAALNVVLGHYDIHAIPWLHMFIAHDAAVDMFFALSSFTLCLVYGAAEPGGLPVRRYAVARFARIYPLYAAVTAVVVFALWRHHPDRLGTPLWLHLVGQVGLLGALPIPALSGFAVLQAWSVGVEALCYATVFPLLFVLARRRISRRVLGVAVVAGGAVAFMAYRWHYTPAVQHLEFATFADRWAYWVASLRGAGMFVAGWAAFLLWRNGGFATVIGQSTDAIALLCVLIVMGERYGLLPKQAVVLLAPLLIAGLMDPRSLTARLLASTPVHALGVISYSMYLLHLEVYGQLLSRFPQLAAHEVSRIGVPVLVTLVAATASYTLFETPARRLLRRWLGAAPISEAAPVSSTTVPQG